MRTRTGSLLAIAVVVLTMAACAVRLGGAKPEPYNAIGLRATATESASDIAGRIRAVQGDLVMLSANHDSAWFADVATKSGLTLTRPGHTGPSTLGLLTHLTSLGDTALDVVVAGNGKLHIKDALYKIDKDRSLDLMLVSFADVTSVREGVRALLNYIATDVQGTSAVVFGIDAPTKTAADSASSLVRAAFANALECGKTPTREPAGGIEVNVFFGPEARLTCTGSRVIAGSPNAIVARVLVER